MARKLLQQQLFDQASGANEKTLMNDIVAIGTVVDTNDPQQLGRVRAVVPAWGDSWHHEIDAMPWCMYVTPFGGQVSTGTRGPGLAQTEGGVSYGMWAVPKIGAQIVVTSLDEQKQHRLYLGCVYVPHTTHTMPHGRWISDDHPEIDGSAEGKSGKQTKPKPYGPLSSREKPIEPLASNMAKAFGNKAESFEWRSRVADYGVSRNDVSHLSKIVSKVQDDLETTYDDWSSTQGYQNSRIDPTGNPNGKNYDSHTYSLTSPGFHAISMDDRMENCRIRLRTTGGHQILMDDTNERIYIATAQGNNWIELDQSGNIDIFTSNKVNIRAKQDINFTSDQSIRMHAKEGIHMHSDKEIRMKAKEDIHTQTDKNIRTHAFEGIFVESNKNTNLVVGEKLNIYARSELSIKTDSNLKIQSIGDTNLKASGTTFVTATKIHLNGPTAANATKAVKPKEKPALFTNRVPDMEPWGRCMTKKDDGHEPELSYDDPNMGKMEKGKEISRGYYWRR